MYWVLPHPHNSSCTAWFDWDESAWRTAVTAASIRLQLQVTAEQWIIDIALCNLQKKRCRHRKQKIFICWFWRLIFVFFTIFFGIFLCTLWSFPIQFMGCQWRIWFLQCPHQVSKCSVHYAGTTLSRHFIILNPPLLPIRTTTIIIMNHCIPNDLIYLL